LDVSQFAKHIGTVKSPSDFLRVEHSDLSEEGVDVCVAIDKVNIHEFVTVGELRGEVALE
jgi:hypothetical protein